MHATYSSLAVSGIPSSTSSDSVLETSFEDSFEEIVIENNDGDTEIILVPGQPSPSNCK